MRINWLDLTKYGHFTDCRIDFGSRSAGSDGPDFHIIYGDNETGKSTLRDAYLHFLYGFPQQIAYNFKHPNKALEIGANLTLNDRIYTLKRFKRKQQDLLESDDTPVSHDVFRSALGGISEDHYRAMFSLDEKMLEAGSAGLLRSEGNLGQVLFSAASGLSDLGEMLGEIKKEAEHFYKLRARSFELKDLAEKLKDLKQKILELDTNAETFQHLTDASQSAQAQYKQARDQQSSDRLESKRLEAILGSIPLWRQYNETITKLKERPEEPDLPKGWLAEARDLDRKQAANSVDIKHKTAALDKARKAHAAIHIDEVILELAPDIKRLKENEFEARFLTSRDITLRQAELDAVNEEISRLLQSLDQADCTKPSTLILPTKTTSSLTTLIDEHAGFDISQQTAGQEFAEAEETHQKAVHKLADLSDLKDLSLFQKQYQSLSSKYPDADLAASKKNIAKHQEEVRFALSNLSPWVGTPEELLQLTPPSNTILAKLKSSAAEIRTHQYTNEKNQRDVETAIQELQSKFDARSTTADVLGDEAMAEIRLARDKAWTLHQTLLEAPIDEANKKNLQLSAKEFEAAMREDDKNTMIRYHQTFELASQRQLQIELSQSKAKETEIHRIQIELEKTNEKLMAKVAKVMNSLNLPPNTPLADLELWLEKRQYALEKYKSLSFEQTRHDNLAVTAKDIHSELLKAMKSYGLKSRLSNWSKALSLADQAIEDWKAAKTARTSALDVHKATKQALKIRQDKLTKAIEAKREWQEKWDDLLNGCWLGQPSKNDRQTSISPQSVRELLADLMNLKQQHKEADDLQARIEGMKADRDNYISEVSRMGRKAGDCNLSDAPLSIADTLRARLTKAQQNQKQLAEYAEEIKTREKTHNTAKQTSDELQSRFAEMTRRFPANNFTELLLRLEQAQTRHDLQEKAHDLETQIIDRLECLDFSNAKDILAEPAQNDQTYIELKEKQSGFEATNADMDDHVQKLFLEWKNAQQALEAIGGDGQVALMQQEKRTLLLEIKAKSLHFLELSAGIMLLERALQKYRETHKKSLMEQASQAFTTITSGAYSGIQSVPDGSDEILVGIRRNGQTVQTEQMSKGTRSQLYLSLRVAGHGEFADNQPPPPFFADDILETFDDERVTQTMKLLEQMSRRGQVIYLTHHRHICALASKTCGSSVTIHKLPDLHALTA